MSKVINFKKWKRARLGTPENVPIGRRARPTHPGGGPGFVTIGVISSEIIRRLSEE